MITIRNLTKKIEAKTILASISVAIDENEFIAILGASGSGKSVLLRCLSLREKWDQGQYIIDGNDLMTANVLERWKHRNQWAYLEEKPALQLNQTAFRNVMGGRIRETPLWR